jgi:hypothetical protein
MKKVLLSILPYWSPIVPPVGLAALKSFLQPRGYKVKAVDVISKIESLKFYYDYFKILRKHIPEEKRGNFYNIGNDVLQQHMMTHLNYKEKNEYIKLAKLLIYNHYYVKVNNDCILELNALIGDFYETLRRYFLYLLECEKPDVVGITLYKATLPASLFVLKLVKETHPHIKTIVGGGIFADSHAVGTPNFETLLDISMDYLDNLFVGQGELLILKYLRGELPGSQRVYTIEDLKPETLAFEDINIPDFSDFNVYKYGYLAATGSISCQYQCSFCNETKYWGKFRKKKVSQTVAEMTRLSKIHKRQLFFMTDSLLNPVVTELANEIITQNTPLYYDAYFRIDNAATDIQNTSLWRQGGLYRVRLGIESGSQRMLDKMKKGIKVDQVKVALSSLAYSGIKTTTYWVIGHPGETEEDFQKTLDLIEEIKDSIWQAECNPFRYYFNGHNCSGEWDRYRVPLYPGKAKDMLVFQEWALDLEPSRQVIYERVNRFVEHCKKLGIPNPYSTNESCEADKRWHRLHKNAVPPATDFMGVGSYIDEIKHIKPVSLAVNTRESDSDFTL